MTLDGAAWREVRGFDALIEALGPGSARLVGGVVRDSLLGMACADLDLATVHAPDAVMRRLAEAGIKAVPTGLAHGTITAVIPGGPVEVTTLRRDLSTDGRHAVVAFTDDWREDAARRDFTINALYADPVSAELFDYFGGLDDLAAGRVRFIGDPYQRIAEDHLRILRFFRFHARFGDAIDAAGLDACSARANDLMALSRERIAGELLRLLVAVHAMPVIELMIARGIFAPVLPEIADAAPLARLAAREAAAGVAPDPIRRLAALLPRDADIAEAVAARLKLSNHDRKRLVAATAAPDAAPPLLAYRAGLASATDRLLLGEVPPPDIAALQHWAIPRFPLTGGAIVARGVNKGPDVARLLREVEEAWIDEGFPPQPRVDQLADAIVGNWLRAASNA